MLKWPTLNSVRRDKAYSDFCSHEFNTFLKLKDPEFFESTVRPFLKNKVEKTVVDYWLLDNPADALSRFLEPHSNSIDFNHFIELCLLNPFELCLMVHHLAVTLKNPFRARSLAVSLIERSPEPNQNQLNRIYDQILSMNQLNNDKSAPPSGNNFLLGLTPP